MSQPASLPLDLASERWLSWDRYVAAAPQSGFMQSSWYADFRADWGFTHFAVIFRHEGQIVGGATVLRYSEVDGQCFYYLPEGPVLPDDPEGAADIYRAILDAIDEHRAGETDLVSHLRIEPRWSALPHFATGLRHAARDRFGEPRHTRCVNLRPPLEEILAQMKPKGRYNIRLAERHGVRVVEDPTAQGLVDFLRLYQAMVRRQRIARKPREYFEGLLAKIRPEHGSLFFAEHQGVRLATALTIWFGARATYFFGASLDSHREVMAPYALHWAIMCRAKALGLESYDLWGVAPPGAVNHPWQDITAFKEKFGGDAFDFIPAMDLVYDHGAYDRHIRAALVG